MRTLLSAALLLPLMLPLFSSSVMATSTGIQMLPPMQSDDASEPCKGSEGNKLLSWDGETSIKCNQNATITATGLFVGSATSGGYLQLGATDAVNEGAQLFMRGAGNYDTWYPDVNQNNLRFYTQSTHANQVQMFNNGTGVAGLFVEGDVGVGVQTPTTKLDVAGGVKVANDAEACTAAKAGTIRWNVTMQYCDGSAWKNFGGTTVKVDYTQCTGGKTVGTASFPAYATGANNDYACPVDYVVVATDSSPVGGSFTYIHCCKLKIE